MSLVPFLPRCGCFKRPTRPYMYTTHMYKHVCYTKKMKADNVADIITEKKVIFLVNMIEHKPYSKEHIVQRRNLPLNVRQ